MALAYPAFAACSMELILRDLNFSRVVASTMLVISTVRSLRRQIGQTYQSMASLFLRSTSTPRNCRFCVVSLVTNCPIEDIYDISSVDRWAIKIWISTMMGHKTFHRGWPKSEMQMLKEADMKKPKAMKMPSL